MTGAFEFSMCQRIIFGAGKISELGAAAAELGKKALVTVSCGPPDITNAMASRVTEILKKSGVGAAVFTGVTPNPTTDSIDAAAEIARGEGCDVVIGVGGGSSMDTAKGAAVAAAHPGGIWDYAIGKKAVTSKTLPVIAVSTTSGTGSQCTQFAVITNPATRQKPGMGSRFIIPRAALIDPELMLSKPLKLTVSCGFDVFAHAVEAYTSTLANPVSDMFAEKAVGLVAKWLPAASANGRDTGARGMMALADTYAGIAINSAVVSLAHSMAHVIGGFYPDIAHGDALFTIYKEVLKFNSKGLPEKHGRLADLLDKNSKSDIVKAFGNFWGGFDFESRLASKKPDSQTVREMAAATLSYMKGCADLNPVPASEEDVAAIIERSVA